MWDAFDGFLKSPTVTNVLCFKVKINSKTKKVNHIAIVQIKQHIEYLNQPSGLDRNGVSECGHRRASTIWEGCC